MARKKSLKRQLEELAQRLEPSVRDAFLGVIDDIKDNALIGDMIRSIEKGDVAGAFRATGLTPAAMRPIDTILQSAFEQGALITAAFFPHRLFTPNGQTVFRFDIRDSRAEAWLRNQSSELVTNITTDTLKGIQTFLEAGMIDGRNPRNTALDIIGRIDPVTKRRVGGIVGLTEQQAEYVLNARRELSELNENYFTRERRDKRFDRTVRAAIDAGKNLDADTVSKITARYSDNLLKLRGETIARTETLAALNQSEREAMAQAIDIGAVRREGITKEWDATGDDGRTRRDHLEMDGQKRGFDEPFVAPDGSRLMHPGDRSMGATAKQIINCRCKATYKIDWLRQLDFE